MCMRKILAFGITLKRILIKISSVHFPLTGLFSGFSLAETEPALTIIRNSSFINCSVVTALGGNAYVPGHYYNGMEVPITNGGAIGINGKFKIRIMIVIKCN